MFSSLITQFAAKAKATTGFRRMAAAFAFGALTSLAYAPLNIFPVLFAAFPALYFLLQGVTRKREAFAVGWSFSFGVFTFSLYWICAAMFVDIAQFWWAVPLALTGLPMFLGLYYGLACVAFCKYRRNKETDIILFAVCWFITDLVRGFALTGFPWNLEGYVWVDVLPVLQIVSVVGIYGLTFMTLVLATLPALLAQNTQQHRRIVVSGFAFFALMALWGWWRIPSEPVATVPDVRLRLVQPNTDQATKWQRDELEPHFQYLLDLSSAPAEKPVTHIIWPETAATFYLAEDIFHRRLMAAHIPEKGAILTGVIRREMNAQGHLSYYNSMVAVDAHANIVAAYDKAHLVPFGEYVPWQKYIPIRSLANLGLDFSSGDGHPSLRVEGLPPFSPLICYEAIFSGEVSDPDDRPDFIINITNDGWYGRTAGPYQHFAIARVRAVEEGLPLARAANTGISGVIDPYGRPTARMGVSEKGYIDADLPQKIDATIFRRFENAMVCFFTICHHISSMMPLNSYKE